MKKQSEARPKEAKPKSKWHADPARIAAHKTENIIKEKARQAAAAWNRSILKAKRKQARLIAREAEAQARRAAVEARYSKDLLTREIQHLIVRAPHG